MKDVPSVEKTMPDRDGINPPEAEVKKLMEKTETDALGNELAQELLMELSKPVQAEAAPVLATPESEEAPLSEAERAWMSSTEAFSLPKAKDFPVEGVWYETPSGERYLIMKTLGGSYHISGGVIEGTPALSRARIEEKAKLQRWRRVKSDRVAPESSPEVAKPFLENENEEVLFVGTGSGNARWNKVVRVGSEYFFISPSGDRSPANTEEQIRNAAKLEAWQLVTDDTEYRRTNSLLSKEEGGVSEASNFPKIGEVGVYQVMTASGLAERRLIARSSGYFIVDENGVVTPYSEADVRNVVEGWILLRIESESTSTETRAPEPTAEVLPLLAVGETTVFERTVRREQLRQKVERTAEGYYFFAEDGTREDAALDEAAARKRLEGWRPIEVDTEAVKRNELLATLDAEVAKLRGEVDAERSAFATKGEELAVAKKRLSSILRGVGFGNHLEEELLDYQQYYENALLRWKNAELERLRQRGLDRDSLREAMAVLIREFEFEEAERLYDEQRKARMERTSKTLKERADARWAENTAGISKEDGSSRGEVAWSRSKYVMGVLLVDTSKKAIDSFDALGEGYNKLVRGKYGRLILGATLVGAGAAAFGTGGTAVGMALLAKRIAAGAGLAVTARGAMDRYADYKREKKKAESADREEVEKVMFEVGKAVGSTRLAEGEKALSGIEDFEALSAYLDREGIKKTQTKARRRRVFEVWRKGGSYAAGLAIGVSGIVPKEWFEGVSFGSTAQAATLGEGARSAVESAPAPAEAVSAPSGTNKIELRDTTGALPGVGPAIDGPQAVSESLKDTRAIPAPAEASEVSAKKLLESYKVKSGDSIWEIAERSVEGTADMDKRASARFAKLLELKLQEKLTVIDPKLAEAAGFSVDSEGRFTPHHIRAGANLELGKLLSAEEMAKMIEEAKGDGRISLPEASVSPMAPDTAATAAAPALTEAEIAAREQARLEAEVPAPVSASERADTIASFAIHPSQELIKPEGNVMKYVETLPREEQEKLFRNFKKLSVEIFQTQEVMGGENYEMRYDPVVHPELAKTNVTTVISDYKLLGKSPFTSYDRLKNPLHFSQMEEVVKFSKAVTKAFGEVTARPRASESVQEYILRMAAIADFHKEKIPGFRMLN